MDNLPTSGGHWRPAGWRRYALALSAIAVAFAVTALLTPHLDDEVLFTPLVGTVVVSVGDGIRLDMGRCASPRAGYVVIAPEAQVQ